MRHKECSTSRLVHYSYPSYHGHGHDSRLITLVVSRHPRARHLLGTKNNKQHGSGSLGWVADTIVLITTRLMIRITSTFGKGTLEPLTKFDQGNPRASSIKRHASGPDRPDRGLIPGVLCCVMFRMMFQVAEGLLFRSDAYSLLDGSCMKQQSHQWVASENHGAQRNTEE